MCFRIDIDVFNLFFQVSLGLQALNRLSLTYSSLIAECLVCGVTLPSQNADLIEASKVLRTQRVLGETGPGLWVKLASKSSS